MPRNVVTLTPRRLATALRPWRRNRDARQTIVSGLAGHYRVQPMGNRNGLAIDFPERIGGRAAKAEVIGVLNGIDPNWARYFVLYANDELPATA